MAYLSNTNLNKSSNNFSTKLYTGTGAENAISGVGHQPDLVWIKKRSGTGHQWLQDTVRGIDYQLRGSATNAENNYSQYVKSIQSDGFTLGTDGDVNGSGSTYVSWNWKAGTTGSGNTTGSGTYKAYSYSVSTVSGISIVKYKGNGTAGHTIPHHLGTVPQMYMVKKTSGTGDWYVYHHSFGATKFNKLNAGDNPLTNSLWNNTAPTSTVFSIDNNSAVNGNDEDYICYLFSERTGYSKISSYVGNQNANGTFIFTGMKPQFILWKNITDTYGWYIIDATRDPDNVAGQYVYTNSTDAEATNAFLDILSNGFKIREAGGGSNHSGDEYMYLAFGQSLVGSNNVPCTAR